MKGSFFLVMLAAASLLGCGKSDEPAVFPAATEAPRPAEPAPVESVPAEPVPAAPVAAPMEAPPVKQPEAAPIAPAKSAQPAAVAPAQTVPASPAPKAAETAPVAPKPDPAHGQQIYRQACAFCHDKGIAGAPKPGDAAAWSARLAQGMDALYNSALRGKGAMPAKGGSPSLTDADVQAAVDFIASQSR